MFGRNRPFDVISIMEFQKACKHERIVQVESGEVFNTQSINISYLPSSHLLIHHQTQEQKITGACLTFPISCKDHPR
jgi:hypothetical protein